MKEILLSKMTWEDVKKCIEEKSIVLVPIGSIEEHGPHLPLSTDSIIAEEVAKETARRVIKEGIPILVAPTIPFGYNSKNVMKFPGTIALGINTFIDLVSDYLNSLISHGFRRILVVNAHGQNCGALRVVARKIYEKTSVPIAIVPLCMSLAKETITKHRRSDLGGVMHAGEVETSIILYLNKDLVKLGKASKEVTIPPSPILGGDVTLTRKIFLTTWSYWRSEKGVLGDPTVAREEFGKMVFDRIVKELVSIVKELYLKVFPKIEESQHISN